MKNKLFLAPLLLGLILVTGCNQTTIKVKEDGTTKQQVSVENITFDNIKLVYEDGITNLTADVIKNTNKKAEQTVKINLKDDKGNVVKSMRQIVETSDDLKVLKVGIIGDYSYIKNVEFEVEK